MTASRVLLLLGFLLLAACETGVPTGLDETLLFVIANPKTIPSDGRSLIEVTARDANTGVEVPGGTEVRLTTTLGQLDKEVIFTDSNGVAQATLLADGRPGMAEVQVTSGRAAEATVVVRIGPPSPDFSCTADGLTVIFEDQSEDASRWRWDFGDGHESEVRDPVHTFSFAGTYVVTLFAGGQGGEDSVSKFVSVSEETNGDVCSVGGAR